MNSKAICHCSEDRCPCEAIEDSHLAQCPMCDDWANITEGNWCNACLNYGPPERWTEVEVVTYDDLIEDQVAATEALLEEEESDFGDVDEPCKGCGTPVSTPLMLMPIDVYCNIECFALRG